jgi:hypothetical protein
MSLRCRFLAETFKKLRIVGSAQNAALQYSISDADPWARCELAARSVKTEGYAVALGEPKAHFGICAAFAQ